MPLRRRTTGSTPGSTRRPRVAGLAPAAARPGAAAPAQPSTPVPAAEPGRADAALPAPPDTGTETAPATASGANTLPEALAPTAADAGPDGATPRDSGADPERTAEPAMPADPQTAALAATPTGPAPAAAAGGGRGRIAAVRARPGRALAVAAAVFGIVAIGLGVADHLVRSTPAAANSALADVGATTDVAGQLNSALETVYSYDFTQLDENERLARDVITPAFAVKFDQLFAQVRQLAPQQQAVVSATVTTSAVQSIEGDRAVLVAFLDQQATRANPAAEPQQLNAAGRLTVIAERDGDAWKIADVLNR